MLVLAAPFAGGELFAPGIAVHLVVAFVAFSIAASGIYLINDANDVQADRAHPTKRLRPIAAGVVPVRLAIAVAVVLLAGALALSLLAGVPLLIVVGVYVAVQLSYCFWLKHQPVLDICIVASGFLLRAIAGGAATDIPLSQWFPALGRVRLAVHGAGKRYAGMVLSERPARRSASRWRATRFLPAVRVALSATTLIMPTASGRSRSASRGAQHGLVGDLQSCRS